MCRIAGFIGPLKVVQPLYRKFIPAFVKSAYSDPYAAKIFNRSHFSHRDGWGSSHIRIHSGRATIEFRKSLNPIYVEKPPLNLETSADDSYYNPYILALYHARAASPNTGITIFNVQPFIFTTKSGNILVIAHNGSVDKEKIVEKYKGDLDESFISRYSDSFFLGFDMARDIEGEIIPTHLSKYKQITTSSLNLEAALITDNYVQFVFGNYYLDESKGDYYAIYVKTYGNAVFFSSSTAVDLYLDKEDEFSEGWTRLENGEFYSIKVNITEEEERVSKTEKFRI